MKCLFSFLIFVCAGGYAQQNTIEQKMRMAAEYKTKQSLKTERQVSEIQTVTYSVDSIGYAPFAEVGTPILIGVDDLWSAAVAVSFNFCYFGNMVDSLVVGANGQLTFDLTQAGHYNSWPITTALPNAVDMPGNTICGPFRDIDPSVGGNTFYQIIGTSPNKIFVVSWVNIPLFSCGAPNSTFQIALYENTNSIDVIIGNSSGSCSWNGNYGIIGIQDATATNGICPPNRNFPGTWTAINEAWRFSPISGPCFTTGVNLQRNSDSFSIYPNPNNGIFHLETNRFENNMLEIYNSVGQKIINEKLQNHSTEINLSEFNSGIYFSRVISGKGSLIYQSKIVKQ